MIYFKELNLILLRIVSIMNEIKNQKPTGPWYRNYEYWKNLAEDYINASKRLPNKSSYKIEFESFSTHTGYRLIFESNLIEGTGLSKGETQKAIQNNFRQIPNTYEAFKDLPIAGKISELGTISVKKYEEMIKRLNVLETEEFPKVSFGGKSRDMLEVIRHYNAYFEADSIVSKFMDKYLKSVVATLAKRKPEKKEWLEAWQDFTGKSELPHRIRFPQLLSEKNIKHLHKTMAYGLLPEDSHVKAGEFRIDERTVGNYEVFFPTAILVPQSIKKFIKSSNDELYSCLFEEKNLFEVAAKISYNFVKIHPFPDFNGRLSRLILQMILKVGGVPFAVTLRGDKKGRHRYLSSLKKANNGDLKPYAALIAMRTAETFQEVDDNLKLAGLPSMLTYSKSGNK